MNPIVYETSRPAKTFATNTYLFVGIILTGIGAYYFGTQTNWERPEEYIPLGVCLSMGIILIIAYQGKWKLPNSKPFFEKLEYNINSATNNLECCRTINQNPSHTFVMCSLEGVESFDYDVESKTTTNRTGGMEQGYGAGLGDTSPTGLTYRYKSTTSTIHTKFVILLPSNKKIQVSSSISNISNFALELNEMLAKQNSLTSPQSL